MLHRDLRPGMRLQHDALDTIKTTVHRLRRDYRARLREEISHTVSSPDEIDDELRKATS